MCTLSWFPDARGYHVFFNRDERRARARARGPERHVQGAIAYLAPVDPESSGTWLASNALGVTICLLNRYPAGGPAGPGPLSRGVLVNGLADLAGIHELEGRLTAPRLLDYGPFTLAVLDGERVRLAAWDGRDLVRWTHRAPGLVETSSAVDGDRVRALRREIFEREPPGVERQLAVHRSHWPERGSASVCMHRSDASTVSFSHVTVTDPDVVFRYTDGPPCAPVAATSTRLARTASHSVG